MPHRNQPGRLTILSRLLGYFTGSRPAKSDLYLSISNTTRQTLLGSFVKVADHGAARRKGLLGRKHLAPGEGLWILPCEAVHTFGMQFPIDLVYVDRKNRVRKLRSSVRPGQLSMCLTAHSVLELASGTIRVTQTQPGDTLDFSTAVPQAS
jgi:uncharacterized protein